LRGRLRQSPGRLLVNAHDMTRSKRRFALGSELPGLDSSERKLCSCNGEATDKGPLAHTLPTSCGQDSDLALIVGVWDRLPEDVRAAVVAKVKACAKSEE
jgi:hypothetical protein